MVSRKPEKYWDELIKQEKEKIKEEKQKRLKKQASSVNADDPYNDNV